MKAQNPMQICEHDEATTNWPARRIINHYGSVLAGMLSLFTLTSTILAAEPAYVWEEVTLEAPFKARDGGGAIAYDGKMWLIGGWNPRDKEFFPLICNNEVWSSTDGKAWSLVKPNTFKDKSFDATADWEGRHYAGYVVHRDKMWIVGGDVNQGHYHFDVWNSTDGRTWSLANRDRPIPWSPRAFGYTVAFDDRIWVLGGQTIPQIAPAEPLFHRDIWTTTDGVDWKQIEPQEPCWSARALIGGQAVFKDRIWVIGGGLYDTPKTERTFHNDVWSSADGIHWEQHLAEAPWSKRQMHEVAVFDERLWVLEGWNETNRNDVWYSPDGVTWTELKNTPWNPRHAASVYVHDGSLWMVAGNNMQPDVWRLRRVD